MDNTVDKPSWLTEEFMSKALKVCNSSQMKVERINVTAVLSPGNNYISDIYRIFVETNCGFERTVIVKCLPTAEYNLKFIADACLFEKETKFYSEILPAMYHVEANSKGEKTEALAPHCFYIERNSVLILEDLTANGFKMADRHRGLSLEETVLAVEALARFHVLTLDIPNLENAYSDTLYCGKDYDHAYHYVSNGITALAAAVETWPGFREMGIRLRETAKTAHARIVELLESKCSPLRVLNHGDFWTNNIMFKRDTATNQPVAVRIVDFQMLRYGSPVLDLLLLLNTSVAENVRHEEVDTVLKRYYAAFCSACKRIGVDVPISLEELHSEMERNAFFGFLNACLMLPVVLAERGQAPDLGSLAQNPDTTMECHAGSTFRRQFQRILLQAKDLL